MGVVAITGPCSIVCATMEGLYVWFEKSGRRRKEVREEKEEGGTRREREQERKIQKSNRVYVLTKSDIYNTALT